MNKLSELERATGIFVIIGAINWGLVGAFGFNLLLVMFNTNPMLERIVQMTIGASGCFWLYKVVVMRR